MMYKFRSMHVQTDEEEREQWTTKDDPRKTNKRRLKEVSDGK